MLYCTVGAKRLLFRLTHDQWLEQREFVNSLHVRGTALLFLGTAKRIKCMLYSFMCLNAEQLVLRNEQHE